MKNMKLRDLIKLIREAQKNHSVIVFNFGEKELDYADPKWKVVDELAKKSS